MLTENQKQIFKEELNDRFLSLREEISLELLSTDEQQYIDLAGEVHDLGDASLADLLVDLQLEKFWDRDNGGFFSTPATTELWVREKEASDGATLSVNGISLQVLLQLGELSGQQSYLQYAWQTAAWSGAQLQNSAAAMPYSLVVWDELIELNPVQTKAAGPAN